MKKIYHKNVNAVLEILRDEIQGDVHSALKKLTHDYAMTWVYKNSKGVLFPRTQRELKKELQEVYAIQGRQYDIKNIAEGKHVVMIELIESYPHPKTGKIHRTPEVIVLEMKNGKIRKGRHYCDPRLSHLFLSKAHIERIFK